MKRSFDLSPDAWRRLRGLLDQALALPAGARQAWLATLQGEQAALAPRLRALLALTGAAPHTLPRLDDADERAGSRVGPYRLLHELGRGGMASVWLAEREDMLQGRRVALKLPHGAWRRPGLAARLAREREILATLEHPHIARLYDAGVADDGQPWIALEHVEGEPVDDWCTRRAAPVAQRVQLMLQVCDAVAHAHARLVVHRDLKPANILVDAAGQAKLLDFGIARLLEDDPTQPPLTRDSGLLLTPEYAAPEQILGRPPGTAADVYSLGVVLYELLAERRPYHLPRTTPTALEEAVLHGVPPRPSDVAGPARRAALRGDLDAIVLKALAKDPAQRYPGVAALAEDLRRHLAHEPVQARPAGTLYRLGRFARRHRAALAGSLVLAVALLGGAGLAAWQAGVALAEKRRADEVRDFITAVIRDADPAAGRGQALPAVELLRRALARIAAIDTQRSELRVELLNVTGEALLNLGDARTAQDTLRQAADEAAARLPADHPLGLQARVLLVVALGQHEHAPELRAQLDTLLPLLRRRLDTHPALLVRALEQQARLELAASRGPAAIAAAREAFALALARLGERDGVTVGASNTLAEAEELHAATPAESIAAAERGLRFAERAHAGAAAHPQVVRVREIHAMALADAGEDARAVAQWEAARREAVLAHGPDSLVEGLILGNMVAALRRLGRVEQALQAAARSEALLGERLAGDSRTRALHLTYRGTAWLAARRGGRAAEDLAAAHAILARLQGAASLEALDARMLQAVALAYAGRHTEAQRELAEVLPATQASFPDSLHHVHHARGIVLRLAGRPAEALAAQQQALQALPPRLRGTPLGTYLVERIRPEIGFAQLALGQQRAALETLQQSLAEMERRQQAVPPLRAEVWAALALARRGLGQPEPAQSLQAQADAFWRGFDPDGAARLSR
ncbi:serine/threonine-protein kinase [Piscinibacter defluvii]|uniref:serine/threonine-protein kinase n=1 Tax=Piscinibacter defluvii TaxID=1796922 RepID=UPI000FDEA474|nr:serine/threonine-protein kinase [Piscinibacter defluvii]